MLATINNQLHALHARRRPSARIDTHIAYTKRCVRVVLLPGRGTCGI